MSWTLLNCFILKSEYRWLCALDQWSLKCFTLYWHVFIKLILLILSVIDWGTASLHKGASTAAWIGFPVVNCCGTANRNRMHTSAGGGLNDAAATLCETAITAVITLKVWIPNYNYYSFIHPAAVFKAKQYFYRAQLESNRLLQIKLICYKQYSSVCLVFSEVRVNI